MNEKLLGLIRTKSTQENVDALIRSMEAMLCQQSILALDEETLASAIDNEGEFLLLEGSYDDFTDESGCDAVLLRKLNEALSIHICFEDDGSYYEKIESFVSCIYEHTEAQQRFVFGVKEVTQLSSSPVRILLSEIYPINQLDIALGEWVYDFIGADEAYFKEHFRAIREKLSREIGINILPLNTEVDRSLDDNEVILYDTISKEKIVSFSVEKDADKKGLDIYLLKLYYILLKLGAKYQH
jgi:hypothetical protein